MQYRPSLSDANIKRLTDPTEVISSVVKEFDESERILGTWKRKIVKYYELYQMVQKKKHYEGLANIFVPEILRAVETIVAKLYQMIFSQPDWFEYAGRDEAADVGASIALTNLTKYQMDENNFQARNMDAFRQMVIAGLTVRKIGWDFDEVERRVPGPRAKDGSPTTQRRIDTIKDTWTFEPVDLLTFQISDINVPYNDIQKARWIGEQYIATKVWVNERCRRGWFSKEMKDILNEEPTASESTTAQNVKDRLNSSGFSNLTSEGKYEIMERWGLVPCQWVMTAEEMAADSYENDDLVEGVIVIANRVAILKLERNPFNHGQKPYVACPYIPKEFELPGIGVCQIGESLQEEINDTRNQTMDNKTLILACMWLRSKTAGIKNDQLKVRPNGIIDTLDMEGLVPLRPPVVTGVGTNMEGVAKNDLREGSGAASNLQGIAQAGVGTATESSIINKESIGRILMTAQLYCQLVLKPTLVFSEFLNYQFYDHVKVINVIGKIGVKFRQLSPDEIAGGHKNAIIKISLDATENPSIIRQQFMNFFQILQQMPPQLIAFHWKSLDKAYGMFFAGHSLDELYPNPQGVDPDELLTPEDERDMVLAMQPVVAVQGQDHQKYLAYHEKEFAQMRYGLKDMQFEIYKKLIMSHYEMMQQELEIQHQQAMAAMDQEQKDNEQGGSSRGKSANSSPNTATEGIPTVGNIRQGLGG